MINYYDWLIIFDELAGETHLTSTDTRVLAAQHEVQSLQLLISSLRQKYYDCNDTIMDIQQTHVIQRTESKITPDLPSPEPTPETAEDMEWEMPDWADDPMDWFRNDFDKISLSR